MRLTVSLSRLQPRHVLQGVSPLFAGRRSPLLVRYDLRLGDVRVDLGAQHLPAEMLNVGSSSGIGSPPSLPVPQPRRAASLARPISSSSGGGGGPSHSSTSAQCIRATSGSREPRRTWTAYHSPSPDHAPRGPIQVETQEPPYGKMFHGEVIQQARSCLHPGSLGVDRREPRGAVAVWPPVQLSHISVAGCCSLLPIAMAVKCTKLDRSGRARIADFATGC